jgi:hypothetical protein
MNFINPIEILGLSNVTDTTSIDNEIVRKAKRKLFAEIDLSDNGLFEYYGLQLTKGDCEKVIDELTNNDMKEFYLYLSSNKKLNIFLVNGNDAVFINFKQDSIFMLPEFVKFISPYFAPKFDKAILNAFITEDVYKIKSILLTSFLITQNDINIAFKSVTNLIQNKIIEINDITKDIKNEESVYDEDDIDEVVGLVVSYFPTDIINILPQYFQSQILKIAKSINYLQLSIWDAFDNTQVPNDLLEHLLTLNIGGLDKPTFENNYKIVKKKNEERIEQGKNAPILIKYAKYLMDCRSKINEVERKIITPVNLVYWVNSSISLYEINNLSSEFDEIKNQVAISLRAMSVEVWNSFSDIDVSIDLINKANNIIGLKPDTKENIQDAKKQLTELKTKIDLAKLVKQRVSRPVSKPPTSNSKDVNYGCLWSFVFIVGIGVMFWAIENRPFSSEHNANNESNTAPVNNNNSYTYDNTTPEVTNDNTTPATTNEYIPPVESKYKGNQLKNGASPLNGCFGNAIYSGEARLVIDNGGSADAIVCLYNIYEDRTIRNEYVKKNSSFTMSNIGQGKYKIRVFSGNDWNPNLVNSCGTKGNFESDVNFSEFDGIQNFGEDGGYSVTLHTVANGNASSSSIDQSQFFKK